MHKLYFLSLLLLSFISHAQVHLLKEIPLSDQVNSAEVIAEGEVIAKKSYWDSSEVSIGLTNYPAGIYFTKVSDATGSQSLRFVKE